MEGSFLEMEFNLEKWRAENPMDYLLAMNLINQSSNKNEVFMKIYKITRLHLPDVLFKYISLTDDIALNESKLDTLEKQEIYMSDVKNLNDPFDSKAYFYRPDELKKYERLKEYDGKLIDDFTLFVKIASLTANSVNNMPMWAHYSNNHKGFCLSYDLKDKRNVQLSSCTFPVQYTNKRIDVTDLMDNEASKMFLEIDNQIAEGKKEIKLDDLSLGFMASLFCNIKHETWSYEKEYRCTAGAIAKGMPFFSASPKAIYIGMNCSQIYVDKLIKIANELQIPVFRMVFNEYDTNFNLSLQSVT
ncbi:DUF2971 domain-containing protein [Clostridium algidicarnis]|uniref:DUF2971 domain-containing protein n=2 Tax=Clostridium algidicarnis TaxID=37659 RepID=UPI001C0BA41A|nr:DUF2971 domain-containing protein [Clostridium algidicarnis]MBU3227798.1 DUF2971 domain-containing protein [Clostridium algidicarnis]